VCCPRGVINDDDDNDINRKITIQDMASFTILLAIMINLKSIIVSMRLGKRQLYASKQTKFLFDRRLLVVLVMVFVDDDCSLLTN